MQIRKPLLFLLNQLPRLLKERKRMKRVLMKRLKPKFLQQKPCPKTLSQTLKFLKKFKIIKKRKNNRSLTPSIKRQLLLSMTKNLL
jgi:hypothetical protein